MRSNRSESDGRESRDADAARETFCQFRRTREPQALAQVFDLVAQELLLVAHHLGRRGVSPEDLVQETFLDAIRAADSYDPSRPLLPWMCGILVNVARRERRAREREFEGWRFDAPPSEDPAELADAREFAAALREAIAEFPSPQRDVLTLRLVHGLTPTQIAHALGHPAGSVKSWIHRGVERLRHALPPAFAAALASYAASAPSLADQRARLLERAAELLEPAAPSSSPDSSTASTSTSALRSAGLWSALALTLVSCWLAWFAWSSSEPDSGAASSAASAAADELRDARESPQRSAARVAPDPRESPADGALQITAHFASDGAPATLALRLTPRWGADPSFRELQLRTDANGAARVEGLEHGEWELRAERCAPHVFALGPQGARVSLSVPAGVLVRGRAVDEHGAAVGGARVWLSTAESLNDGQYVSESAADGSFELRDVPAQCAIALHAAGFAPSTMILASNLGGDGASFTLSRARREVRGRVLSQAGAPLAGARVLVGPLVEAGALVSLQAGHTLFAPLELRCDERGEFVGEWLAPPWSAPLRARAAGFAAVELSVDGDEPLRVELPAGAVWRGNLRSPALAAGSVTLKADSVAAHPQQLDWLSPRWLGPRGSEFELAGIGRGAQVLMAIDSAQRTCSTLASPATEGVHAWSPECGGPAPLRGVVRRADGVVFEGAHIEALRLGAPALKTVSDAAGEFVFEDLGAAGATLITRSAPGGCVIDRRAGVHGGGEPLELRIPIERAPTAFVVLSARDSAGRELGEVYVFSHGRPIPAAIERLSDGARRVGPFPAGVHHLVVQGEGDEVLHLGPFELEPFAELALGEHTSQPPGQVEVQVTGLSPTDRGSVSALLVARDSGCMITLFKLRDGRGTCMPSAPGDWLLRLMLPHSGVFEAPAPIVSGARTRVELAAPTGVPVTFAVRDGAFDEALALRGRIEQLDSGAVFPTTPTMRRSSNDGLRRVTRNLAPGRYRLELSDGFALSGSAVFAVAAGPEPLEIELELR